MVGGDYGSPPRSGQGGGSKNVSGGSSKGAVFDGGRDIGKVDANGLVSPGEGTSVLGEHNGTGSNVCAAKKSPTKLTGEPRTSLLAKDDNVRNLVTRFTFQDPPHSTVADGAFSVSGATRSGIMQLDGGVEGVCKTGGDLDMECEAGAGHGEHAVGPSSADMECE